VIDFGSEFQTVGAECRKARVANSVLLKGLISSRTSDECDVRAGCKSGYLAKFYAGVGLKPDLGEWLDFGQG